MIIGDTPVCELSTHTYSVTNIAGHSYAWQVTGGSIVGSATANQITVNWASAGTGSITITQTSALGCDSTKSIPVTIHPKPSATIDGSTVACANALSAPYYRQNYQSRQNANIFYEWTVTGGTIVGSNQLDSVSIEWGSSGVHPVYLRAVNMLTGCVSEDTFYVNVGVLHSPEILSQSFAGCIPFSLTFRESAGIDSLDYTWRVLGSSMPMSKSPNPTYEFTVPNIYVVELIVKNTFGCADTARVNVNAQGKPVADFEVRDGENIYLEQTAYFENQSRGAVGYQWDFHDGETSFNFEHYKYYELPGQYTVRLIARSSLGCPDTTYRVVNVKVVPELYIPNAFTPNGDIHNPYFTIHTFYIVEMEFFVFDRWGEIVFRTKDPNFKWDGTYKGEACQDDVYAYYVQARGYNGELIVRKGNITILR
jgi:gliding motility-associated-like protein